MTGKIRVERIDLAQATGLEHETRRRETVSSWAEADAVLTRWSGPRPEQVDFVVHFDDGSAFPGTAQIGPGPKADSVSGIASSGILALMSRDPARASYRKWIDPTGEKRLHAVYLGARYDFGRDTSEPPLVDPGVLRGFMSEENAGKDVGLTVVGPEDDYALVFEDGEPLAVGGLAEAEYLQRQWRIMNGIHPVIGGSEPLFERPPAVGQDDDSRTSFEYGGRVVGFVWRTERGWQASFKPHGRDAHVPEAFKTRKQATDWMEAEAAAFEEMLADAEGYDRFVHVVTRNGAHASDLLRLAEFLLSEKCPTIIPTKNEEREPAYYCTNSVTHARDMYREHAKADGKAARLRPQDFLIPSSDLARRVVDAFGGIVKSASPVVLPVAEGSDTVSEATDRLERALNARRPR